MIYQARFLNTLLRGGVLASKFLLIFFLAVYLNPEELGLYGLVVATIAYGIYPLGFDFYSYNTRELIRADKKTWGRLLKSQGALHVRLYVVFLPLFFLVFHFGLLPWRMAPWFFLLIVLEHVNQECMRLLIAMSKPLSASVALFMRQGVWALILSAWMYHDLEARKLEYVLFSWVLGGIAALFVAMHTIRKLPIAGWREPVDWAWVKKGLKVALPLLAATLSLSAISTIDRYWFGHLQGNALLGAYVFYISLAASLISFLDAAVFSFAYPGMVHAASKGDFSGMRDIMKKMFVQVTIFSSVFFIFAVFLTPPILHVIGREVYLGSEDLFFILIVAMIIHAYSYIPHYALYARHQDRAIVSSHAASVLFFIGCVAMLTSFVDVYAIPVAVAATYLMILIWKSFAVTGLAKEVKDSTYHAFEISKRFT